MRRIRQDEHGNHNEKNKRRLDYTVKVEMKLEI